MYEHDKINIATSYLKNEKDKRIIRLFVNKVTGEIAAFDCAYLKTFGINEPGSELWGESPLKAFWNANSEDKVQFIIMPFKVDISDLIELVNKQIK